ncbi:PREDICTED: uncharacterized protein LOC106338272 [Brassica oleracea var. oleracea]|uniref:uncharacterized protein LOC106338272 n=1 Tax=Brassica oleracea var. oleracea TaxID=109376 RepID=UPI0006A6EE14|nr:PREDICTED: uncharacterized protein LOC106338272 [Brassica oleracea var. oleracea]
MAVSTWPDISHLSILRPELINVLRILVDNGSSDNIIFQAAYKDLMLEESALTRRITPLIGFSGKVMQTAGEVTLPHDPGTALDSWHGSRTFDSSPVGEIPYTLGHKRNQRRPRVFPLWLPDYFEGKDQGLIAITEQTFGSSHRGTGGQRNGRRAIDRRGSDPTSQDMPGIDPEIIMHNLHVDPLHQPVRQKRRNFASERDGTINDEVKSLLGAGFIRKVQYLEWLDNVVVVKKKNEKWRVCIDFTDPNKSCPKDPFHLPHIDKLATPQPGIS